MGYNSILDFLTKLVSKFMKMRSTDPRATVVTYAFFHAFKFPDSMAVHIRYICYNFTISFEFKAIKKAIRHQNPRVKKNWDHLFTLLPIADTVKLGDKEHFDKEQIGVKELNILLDKELLPI